MQPADEPVISNFFLGDLSSYCSESHIRTFFHENNYETVDVRIMRSPQTMESLNYGFTSLRTFEDPEQVIRKLNGIKLCGRKLKIRRALYNVDREKDEDIMNSVHIKFHHLEPHTPVTEDLLADIFSRFGEVDDVSIKSAKENVYGYIQGYAFVHFSSDEEGTSAAFTSIAFFDAEPIYRGLRLMCQPSRNMQRSFSRDAAAAGEQYFSNTQHDEHVIYGEYAYSDAWVSSMGNVMSRASRAEPIPGELEQEQDYYHDIAQHTTRPAPSHPLRQSEKHHRRTAGTSNMSPSSAIFRATGYHATDDISAPLSSPSYGRTVYSPSLATHIQPYNAAASRTRRPPLLLQQEHSRRQEMHMPPTYRYMQSPNIAYQQQFQPHTRERQIAPPLRNIEVDDTPISLPNPPPHRSQGPIHNISSSNSRYPPVQPAPSSMYYATYLPGPQLQGGFISALHPSYEHQQGLPQHARNIRRSPLRQQQQQQQLREWPTDSSLENTQQDDRHLLERRYMQGTQQIREQPEQQGSQQDEYPQSSIMYAGRGDSNKKANGDSVAVDTIIKEGGESGEGKEGNYSSSSRETPQTGQVAAAASALPLTGSVTSPSSAMNASALLPSDKKDLL